MAYLHFLANPARFRRFSQRVLPGLTLATVLCVAVGLYLALLQSPPDYQQGETVRIMFVHVPSAWLSMAGYALLAALGGALLVWRHPLAALMARAAAPVGACFALTCLLTGSLWGRPMWNTYWVWDGTIAYVQRQYEIRLNVYNIGDKTYYIGGYNNAPNRVLPGAPRSAAITVRYNFN